MSAYPTNAREADLMTRKKKPAPPLLDAANPAPAPLTVQDITNKFMGTPPQQVTPAPAFDAQAAARGVEERRAAGNMKLNLRDAYHTEFENQRAAGGITDPTKLASIRSQMTDANTGDPNGRLRSLVEAQRTGMEGPVYTNAAKQKADLTGQQFTTATNEYGIKGLGYKDATDQSVSQRAVAGNTLETERAKQGMRNIPGEIQAAGAKNMEQMTRSQQNMEMMPSQTRADIMANQAREAEMGQTAKNAPAKGAADAAKLAYDKSMAESMQSGIPTIEAQRVAEAKAATEAANFKARGATAASEAQFGKEGDTGAYQRGVSALQEQQRVENAAKLAAIQSGSTIQQATNSAAELDAKRAEGVKRIGDPKQISDLGIQAAIEIGKRVGSGMGLTGNIDPAGINKGVVMAHLTGDIRDDEKKLDAFDSNILPSLESWASVDPNVASRAAASILDAMPTPAASGQYEQGSVGSFGGVLAKSDKFSNYTRRINNIYRRLQNIRGLGS